jgi:hypothetical protein
MTVFCIHNQDMKMEAVKTSETSINVRHTTRQNIPEDSHLQDNTNLVNIK